MELNLTFHNIRGVSKNFLEGRGSSELIFGEIIEQNEEIFFKEGGGSWPSNPPPSSLNTPLLNIQHGVFQHVTHIWFISVYLQLSIMAPFVILLTNVEKYGNYFSIFFFTCFGLIRFYHTLNDYYGKIFEIGVAE